MLKRIKLVTTVLLTLTFISPVQASENWLHSLFPWLVPTGETEGAGFGFGDPRTQEKESIYTANGVGFGGGDPNSASTVTTSGFGFGGGHPTSTQD